MYFTRVKRRASLTAPIFAAALLLAACGEHEGADDTDSTAADGAATTSAAESAETAEATENSSSTESAEGSAGPPPEQDADGIELTITEAGTTDALPNAMNIGVSWNIQPDPTGACSFMMTIYDETGEILTATPGSACQSEIQLNFSGYEVKEFTAEMQVGDQTAVRTKAVEAWLPPLRPGQLS